MHKIFLCWVVSFIFPVVALAHPDVHWTTDDDLGYVENCSYGGGHYKTPNINQNDLKELLAPRGEGERDHREVPLLPGKHQQEFLNKKERGKTVFIEAMIKAAKLREAEMTESCEEIEHDEQAKKYDEQN